MRKSLLAILVVMVIASLPISVQGRETIKASQNCITKNVYTGSFTGLCTTSSIDIEYRQGPLKVQLYAPDNLIKYVEVKVSNNTLTAYYTFNGSITGKVKTKLIVSAPDVTTFTTMGSGDIEILSNYNIKGSVAFRTQGSGDIDAPSVKAEKVTIETQGSGDIDITSIDAATASITTQGSGDIEVSSINSPSTSVATQGSGDIEISSIKSTTASVMTYGSGDIEVGRLSTTGLDAITHASGDILLKGTCVNAEYKSYSSGSIYAKSMNAQIVTVTTYGSGDIDCHASKSITGEELGSGDISVSGNPGQYHVRKRR